MVRRQEMGGQRVVIYLMVDGQDVVDFCCRALAGSSRSILLGSVIFYPLLSSALLTYLRRLCSQ